MAHSNTSHLGGWRAFVIQIGLLVVGAFSILILFSFGGQVIVAPALLPAQWMIARNTTGPLSMSFSILGALLVAEVGWLAMALALPVAEDGSLVVGLVGLVIAVGIGVLFYWSSRPRRRA